MPQKRNNSEPPPVMTWSKASPVLAFAVVFDALRMMFEMFWFFGPALAALACTLGVNSALGTSVAAIAGKITAAGCSLAAGAAGFVGAPAIEAFGVVMAMAVGFAGWLVVGAIIMWTNKRIIAENAGHALWFVGSLLISEIPIVGTFPALTGVAWKMYATQIKKDKEVLQKYEKENAVAQQQERDRQAEQTAQLMQAQAAQLASADVY